MVEIVDLLFYQILQINPSQVTGNFQSDFIYLLLVPTVIIIFVLQALVGLFAPTHQGLRYLVGIVGLAIIIERGWYGFLASLGTTFFTIGIVAAIVLALGGRLFRREHAAGALKAGDTLRRQFSNRSIGSYMPSNKRKAKIILKGLDTEYEDMASKIAEATKLQLRNVEKEATEGALLSANQRRAEIVMESSGILEGFGWTPDKCDNSIRKGGRLYNRLLGRKND